MTYWGEKKLKKNKGETMITIEKYPQYQLYKFTLLLKENKAMFVKPEIESRAVDGTLINRAYYSAYSYALLWLEETHKFKFKEKWEYESAGEKYITEHQQVSKALKDYGQKKSSQYLYDLHKLRKKADYNPDIPLTNEDLQKAINYMDKIINDLDFCKHNSR